jgi:hypothetical protein
MVYAVICFFFAINHSSRHILLRLLSTYLQAARHSHNHHTGFRCDSCGEYAQY